MAEIMYWEAIRRAHDEEMARDPLVICMGEDIGVAGGTYKATQGLYDKYGPERVMDTPISENGYTGLGIGAAFLGVRPIIEIMSVNFAWLAMEFTSRLIERGLVADWALPTALVILATGLPFVLVVAWAQEASRPTPGPVTARRFWPRWAERTRGRHLLAPARGLGQRLGVGLGDVSSYVVMVTHRQLPSSQQSASLGSGQQASMASAS